MATIGHEPWEGCTLGSGEQQVREVEERQDKRGITAVQRRAAHQNNPGDSGGSRILSVSAVSVQSTVEAMIGSVAVEACTNTGQAMVAVRGGGIVEGDSEEVVGKKEEAQLMRAMAASWGSLGPEEEEVMLASALSESAVTSAKPGSRQEDVDFNTAVLESQEEAAKVEFWDSMEHEALQGAYTVKHRPLESGVTDSSASFS